MKILRELEQWNATLPVWGQALIFIALVLFSVLSVYGRINTGFGAKLFSRVSEDQIRSNIGHIVQYTVISHYSDPGLYLDSGQTIQPDLNRPVGDSTDVWTQGKLCGT